MGLGRFSDQSPECLWTSWKTHLSPESAKKGVNHSGLVQNLSEENIMNTFLSVTVFFVFIWKNLNLGTKVLFHPFLGVFDNLGRRKKNPKKSDSRTNVVRIVSIESDEETEQVTDRHDKLKELIEGQNLQKDF